MTMYNIDNELLIHHEGENKFELGYINNYEISTIIYGQLKFLLNEVNKLKDGFIYVPAYKYKENVIQIQLAVTGKCKRGELPIDGIRREISEEIGISIDESDTKINIKKLLDKQNNLYFTLIDNCNLKINKKCAEGKSNKKDNPKEKIIAWIYNKKIDEKLILNRNRQRSNDTAGEIIAILPIKLVKHILEKWSKNEIKKVNRFGFILKD